MTISNELNPVKTIGGVFRKALRVGESNLKTMEKNLPFVSLSLADKGYNKFIIPFLGKLDDGNVFKNIINLLLTVLSFAFLLGGLYLSIMELFGDDGFIKQYISTDNPYITGGRKAGAAVGMLLGFAITIVTAWALFSVVKKRSEKIRAIEYDGLLSFLFIKTIPNLILIIGELVFVLMLHAGVLQLIAALLGSNVYGPLGEYPSTLLNIFPGMEMFDGLVPRGFEGNYDYFGETIKVGIGAVAGSFIVLVGFYVYKEIYNYLVKLATNLIAFLPKFALPLAIRTRKED